MEELNADTFAEIINTNSKPVLVDFWAPWCPPCRVVAPILEELSHELESTITITKIDIDMHPTIASEYSIMSIPTFILFKDGKIVGQMGGAQSKDEFKKFITQNI